MFEITFEGDQTFGLTGFEAIPNHKWPDKKLIFYNLTDCISEREVLDQIYCQTICLTDFQTSQTEATSGSHCPTD